MEFNGTFSGKVPQKTEVRKVKCGLGMIER
jgi:hypothetical protein